MLDIWNDVSLTTFDVLLGWLLLVPRELALIAVAVLSALVLTAIRLFTTDQDRLRRAAEDLRRLRVLRREARRQKDRDALARLNRLKARIGLLRMRAEGKPLLVILLPLALLATWAFHRLEYHPPRAGEVVEVAAYLPVTALGDIIHLVPQPGLEAAEGWVRPLTRQAPPPSAWERLAAWLMKREQQLPPPDAVALWRLAGRPGTYRLVFRFRATTVERELLIGQTIYAPAWDVREDGSMISEVRLREVRLFGIPGLRPWLPAWLVGYLLLTVPLVFLFKRVLAVY